MSDKMIFINENLNNLIDIESIEMARDRKEFSVYKYNGVSVPRVTSIIEDTFSKEYLIQYALSFGNKYSYYNERDLILSVGTKVHEAIEYFLHTGKDPDLNYSRAPKQTPIVVRAYDNFKLWYENLINNGNTFELLDTEIPVVNPYYGGCIDCIAKINNAYYILDFKTSKKISYEYILQTCAYLWTINNGYCSNLPHIDGIGIIRVDKEKRGVYEDLFLNLFIPSQAAIINSYIQGFCSILFTYYNKIDMEYKFNKYKKNYNGSQEVINNNKVIDSKII